MRPSHLATLLAAVSCLSVSAYGCFSPQAEDDTTSGAAAIAGGTEDAKHTFAVGVKLANATCSGVLVAPNVVLTARHCVSGDNGTEDEIDCKTAKFVGGAVAARTVTVTTSTKMTDKGRYGVKDILLPEDDSFCNNDVAALVLEQSVPASEATPATPLIRAPMSDPGQVGKQIAAIGYGYSTASHTGLGTRRIREHIPVVCIPGDTKRDCAATPPRQFITAGYTCSGDAGSGAFVQESLGRSPVLLGVLSTVGPKCSHAAYTRTDTFAKLILTATMRGAQLGRYPLPAWATPSGKDTEDYVDAGRGDPGSSATDAGDYGSSPDPYGTGTSGDSGNWIDDFERILNDLLKILPLIPGADTSSPKTPPLTQADAGAGYDAGSTTTTSPTAPTPTSEAATPAGGERKSTSDDAPAAEEDAPVAKKGSSSSGGCAMGATASFGSEAAFFGLGLGALMFAVTRRRRRHG